MAAQGAAVTRINLCERLVRSSLAFGVHERQGQAHLCVIVVRSMPHTTGRGRGRMPALSLNEITAAMSSSPKIVIAVRAACSTRLSREYWGPCSDPLVRDAAWAMLPLQRQVFRLHKNCESLKGKVARECTCCQSKICTRSGNAENLAGPPL